MLANTGLHLFHVFFSCGNIGCPETVPCELFEVGGKTIGTGGGAADHNQPPRPVHKNDQYQNQGKRINRKFNDAEEP